MMKCMYNHASAKKIVRKGYDKIATSYTAARTADSDSEDIRLLNLLVERLPKRAMILDAGCGSGRPVTRLLAESFAVTGVDFSQEQLRMAKANVRNAGFICADLSHVPFKDEAFDAICSYYSIIHIPRDEHSKLLMGFHRILRTGGLVLLCTGAGDLNEDVGDYLGSAMFWSHYDSETNLRMITESGFELVWSGIVKDPFDSAASHLFVLGKKK